MSHLIMYFVTLVIQGGAMAKFWPLHHCSQCIGENRRKTLSTILHSSSERGHINLIFSQNKGWDVNSNRLIESDDLGVSWMWHFIEKLL